MTRTPRIDVAIVGSGFSGVAATWHLLPRLAPGSKVTLFNASGRFARGLAYGTRSPNHLLNVPAARMSITPEQPSHFVEWLQHVDGPSSQWHGHEFVPRHRYGDYLQHSLADQAARHPWVTLGSTVATVDRCELHGGAWMLRSRTADTSHHEQHRFDAVVLALGHFAPRPPTSWLSGLDSLHYANDPWADEARAGLHSEAPVALIGTGLTMLDAMHSLLASGHRGRILALSRRGLLPIAHREQHQPSDPWPLSAELTAPGSLRKRQELLRREIRNATRQGRDWRDVMAALRPHTAAMWRTMTLAERSRFLRHALPYWDVHRHRAAPEALSGLRALEASGQLSVHAGRVEGVTVTPSGLDIRWRPRGGSPTRSFLASRVLNCSGPSSAIESGSSALLWGLLQQGRLQACPLGLGLQVDDAHRVTDATGCSQAGLYYVGPLLRSQFWEATAVPELREHARQLAEDLAIQFTQARL